MRHGCRHVIAFSDGTAVSHTDRRGAFCQTPRCLVEQSCAVTIPVYTCSSPIDVREVGDAIEFRTAFPKRKHTRIAAPCIVASQVLHQVNVLHRDLKPQNILLSDSQLLGTYPGYMQIFFAAVPVCDISSMYRTHRLDGPGAQNRGFRIRPGASSTRYGLCPE